MTTETSFDVAFGVPDDLFSVEISRDDETAASQLRDFVARRAEDADAQTRTAQLVAARSTLDGGRHVWGGVMGAPVDGKYLLAYFALTVRALDAGETAGTIEEAIERRYGDDASIEPWQTQFAEAVGVRRIGTLIVDDELVTTAVSQVSLLFPQLKGVATVTGIALSLDDLDVTTVIVGAMAESVQLRPRAAAN